jgi:hypothetical protein
MWRKGAGVTAEAGPLAPASFRIHPSPGLDSPVQAGVLRALAHGANGLTTRHSLAGPKVIATTREDGGASGGDLGQRQTPSGGVVKLQLECHQTEVDLRIYERRH